MTENEPSQNKQTRQNRTLELKQVWQAALHELSLTLPSRAFDSWVRIINLVAIDRLKSEAVLGVPSSFAKTILEQDYRLPIQRALSSVIGETLEIQFIVEQPAQTRFFDQDQQEEAIASVNTSYSNGYAMRNRYNYNKPAKDYSNQRFAQDEHYGANGLNGNQPQNYNATAQNGFDTTSLPQKPSYEEEVDYIDEVTGEPHYSFPDRYTSDSQLSEKAKIANLNPRYIFGDYVEGNNNRMAVAAARHVAENPGHSYNPLFIYGNVGLGKTHILHAIGHEALRLRPHLNVLYVSSEKFTNEMVNAIRERSMEDFRNRYRNIDILMIDDIQFIAGKDSTQEEFFHTFNALHDANKQIVISSDRPPKAMLILEDRLRSRFEGGLISDIQPPDYETRLAILRNKARLKAIPIPEEVLEHIARHIQSNIRELEGALTRVVAFALHNRTNLTVELAVQALHDVMYNTRKKVLTPARVVEVVSQFFNMDIKELRGRSRSQDIVLPRQISMYIIREETDTSLVEIGQELGGRDHTTVMHAIEKIEREMETNQQLRQQVNTIIQLLYSEGGAMR
ncbi:MAG: chromosomal replication initiator protein DnaA [Chloroflexi bacterium]|uniref:Chromosomal replication initiator protein DnaA n=1 Tax=Candidatus Chlorohelix allophototropha TaxID=3003348 RepID=A0A8T7M2T2_9CHLR|nr:chromosomal replication initiator protein DnaA [Chloroflexota bacterium]WJW66757.1 chromosomal replication initiator protein DnaA [Chloroflexota bacterium L227-S17]